MDLGIASALVIDGEALTENVAILTWLNRQYTEAELLPPTSNANLMLQRASVQRAMAREAEHVAQLKAEGLYEAPEFYLARG